MPATPFIALAALLATAATAAAQVARPESEPNNTKAQATLITAAAPGDLISGFSSGNQGSGPDSPDYFLLRVADPGPGVFRYRLTPESPVTGMTFSLRGLRQTDLGPGAGGGVSPGTDISIQTATASPAGLNWYAIGPAAVYLRINGSAAAAGDYSLRLTREPVDVLEWPRTLEPGSITVERAPGVNADVDFWWCDANAAAIPGFGNDEPGRLTRDFAAGEYLLAWSQANLALHLPSPGDDQWRSAPVTDFPGIFATFASQSARADLRITDAVRPDDLELTLAGREIRWIRIRIGAEPPGCPPCAADFDTSGGVDGDDIPAFFGAWLAGDQCGDVDSSGGVDGEDLGWFFARWQAGGC